MTTSSETYIAARLNKIPVKCSTIDKWANVSLVVYIVSNAIKNWYSHFMRREWRCIRPFGTKNRNAFSPFFAPTQAHPKLMLWISYFKIFACLLMPTAQPKRPQRCFGANSFNEFPIIFIFHIWFVFLARFCALILHFLVIIIIAINKQPLATTRVHKVGDTTSSHWPRV